MVEYGWMMSLLGETKMSNNRWLPPDLVVHLLLEQKSHLKRWFHGIWQWESSTISQFIDLGWYWAFHQSMEIPWILPHRMVKISWKPRPTRLDDLFWGDPQPFGVEPPSRARHGFTVCRKRWSSWIGMIPWCPPPGCPDWEINGWEWRPVFMAGDHMET